MKNLGIMFGILVSTVAITPASAQWGGGNLKQVIVNEAGNTARIAIGEAQATRRVAISEREATKRAEAWAKVQVNASNNQAAVMIYQTAAATNGVAPAGVSVQNGNVTVISGPPKPRIKYSEIP